MRERFFGFRFSGQIEQSNPGMRKRISTRSAVTATLAAISLVAGPAYTAPALAASRGLQEQAAPPSQAQRAPLPAAQFEAGGWLGLGIAEVTPEKAMQLKLVPAHGVMVSQVAEGSPAAKAGLKQDDIITEYNGQRVDEAVQFRRMVRETPVGHTVQMSIWRDAHAQTLSVEVGSYPREMGGGFSGAMPRMFQRPGERQTSPDENFGYGAPVQGPMLGVAAQDLSGQLGEYFGAPDGEGVLVTAVRAGSAAEKAGLHAGDVIAKVNGERVRNREELRERLRAAAGDNTAAKNVTLGVIRKGAETTVSVQPEMFQRPLGRGNGRPRNPAGGANGLDHRIPL